MLRTRQLGFAMLAVLIVAACGGSSQPSSNATSSYAPVRVVMVPCFCTAFISDSLGLWKKAGLDVTIIPAAQFGTGAVQVVISGQADTSQPVAFASLLQAKAAGGKITAVLNNYVSEPGPFQTARFYVTSNSPIKQASDLKGKKIGLWGKGAYSDYVLQAYLKDHGLTPSDVQSIVVPVAQMESALKSGQIDVASAYDVVYSKIDRDGGARVLFTDLDTSLPVGQLNNVYYFNSDFAGAHPSTVKAFVDVEKATQKWVADNPKQAKQIIAKATNYLADDLVLPPWKLPSCMDPAAANKWSSFMSTVDKTVGPSDGAGLVKNTFNPGCK